MAEEVVGAAEEAGDREADEERTEEEEVPPAIEVEEAEVAEEVEGWMEGWVGWIEEKEEVMGGFVVISSKGLPSPLPPLPPMVLCRAAIYLKECSVGTVPLCSRVPMSPGKIMSKK